jgi:hypothetical protein
LQGFAGGRVRPYRCGEPTQSPHGFLILVQGCDGEPLADTGVTYKIQVEVIEIETFSWLGIANILGFLLLIGMLGFAFKTYRETENSEQKSASEGILAVAKVGSLAAVLAVLGILLLSLFIGYVAFSTN